MNEEHDFQFKHISEEEFNRTYKKISRNRQKLKDEQQWNDYVESIKNDESNRINFVQNDSEMKESEYISNKHMGSQLSTASMNLYSLHDPFDVNHIHGLRNRLFKTFNEFAKILENALLPPVLRSIKKVQIKIKQFDQQLNKDYLFDLDTLLSEIKHELKKENLFDKKNKNNVILRKTFQMKLIQCYKLAIDAIKVCSQTLEAGVYCPIQSKMIRLIQMISSLSLTTGKYIYGELYKKKKKESFDLVDRCKILANMLNESGYKDTEGENNRNNDKKYNNTLNELANKALVKTKTQLFSTNTNRLKMYDQAKPKLGSCYAQEWLKKSIESTNDKNIDDKLQNSCNGKIINEKPCLSGEKTLDSDNTLFNYYSIDNIQTVIQEHQQPFKDFDTTETKTKLFYKNMKKNELVSTDEFNNLPASSKGSIKLKETNNIGLFIVEENIWRKFPLKNINLSQNGCLLLNITSKLFDNICSYKRQFKLLSISESKVNSLFNITELIMEDLLNEVISKFGYNAIVKELVKMELFE